MGKEASEIQTELSAIHRTILGAETSTCTSAVRHELGVKTQLLRANIASLKFPKSHFVDPRESLDSPSVQDPSWGPKKGTMHIKNGTKWHMGTSATAIGWTGALGKEAAKKAARKHALPRQNEQF